MHFSIQHQLLATGQVCAKYGIARLDEFFGAKAELEIILKRDVDPVHTKAVNNPYVFTSIHQSRELACAAP